MVSRKFGLQTQEFQAFQKFGYSECGKRTTELQGGHLQAGTTAGSMANTVVGVIWLVRF